MGKKNKKRIPKRKIGGRARGLAHRSLGEGGQKFWEKEYGRAPSHDRGRAPSHDRGRAPSHDRGRARSKSDQEGYIALSEDPSEDLIKFTRWLRRQKEDYGSILNPSASAVDLGCGNGRNLIYLSREFGVKGVGFDISEKALTRARELSAGLPLEFFHGSLKDPIPLPDESQDLVLDMMSSHILNQTERDRLLKEIERVLKPGGWLLFKTFLLEEDLNAKRMLREYPAGEPGSYIHPRIGVLEHVSTKEEIEERLRDDFLIHKIKKSHKHLLKKRPSKPGKWKQKSKNGFQSRPVAAKPGKRRTITVFAQKG